MHPRWADPRLIVQRNGVVVAILSHDGEPAVAASQVIDMGESPTSWGNLPTGQATTSGRCGPIYWTAGRREWSPELVDPAASWMTVRNGEYWIASGLAEEPPEEWEEPGGKRWPTDYHAMLRHMR